MTCGRAQEFLARTRIEPKVVADATKERKGAKDALQLARAADEIYVAKGKKVVHVKLKTDKPTDQELLTLLLGPSGNLRAPTIRKGKTLLVGFEPEMFRKVLG